MLDGVTVRPSGETAVVLEVGTTIDPAVHDAVLALDRAITAAPPPGVVEVVPSYRSVLLRLDPVTTTPDDVVEALRGQPAAGAATQRPVVHDVVVSFTDRHAEDLVEVAERLGTTPAEVVDAVTEAPLRLYCYGFVPGFAYLGGVPQRVHLPRRETPRRPVQPGAVLLAAGQAALCPVAMPTGWWVVGHTDHALFDPSDDPPVPFAPGDGVRLVRTGS